MQCKSLRISIWDHSIWRQLNDLIGHSLRDSIYLSIFYPAIRVARVLEPIPATLGQDACLSQGQDKRSRIRAPTEVAPVSAFYLSGVDTLLYVCVITRRTPDSDLQRCDDDSINVCVWCQFFQLRLPFLKRCWLTLVLFDLTVSSIHHDLCLQASDRWLIAES